MTTNHATVNMAADASDLEVFKEGITQFLVLLTDEVDDKTATTVIRFALQAVGTDETRLKTLIEVIYTLTTPRNNCLPKLLVKVLETASHTVRGE